ncbi:Reverse transcriptase from transposon X-element protein [Ceratobasidium sp. AG-Ba]|nr:Reverse transcriptase from transposon X-element protein [Ceratobasidium sp. AG-Ba]
MPPLVGKPADGRKASSSAPAAKAGNPKPPVDPPAASSSSDTVPEHPVPRTPEAAVELLASHQYIGKKDAVTGVLICNLLAGIARTEGISRHIANLIAATAVLLPKAFENANTYSGNIYELREAIQKLHEKTDSLLQLAENPVCTVDNLEGHLDKMAKAVTKTAKQSESSLKASEETKSMLISFVEQQAIKPTQGWSKVNNSNRRSHRENQPAQPAEPATNANSIPVQPKKKRDDRPTATLPPEAIQRCRIQAATILVRPTNPNGGGFDRHDAKGLLNLARTALEKAWDAIKDTEFATSRGLKIVPRIIFKTARRIPSGGLLFEMEDYTHAALLSLAPFAIAFETAFGDVVCRGQEADIYMDGAPVSFDPTVSNNIRALEEDNQLMRGSILGCSWVKPAEMRTPGQSRAVLRVSLRSQDIADELIANRGLLEGGRVTFRRIVEEPLRCMKCQKYGHKAGNCRSSKDICSRCAGDHRQSSCENQGKTSCANCKSEEHASWSRSCSAYEEAKVRLAERRPENNRRFFNPTRQPAPTVSDDVVEILEPRLCSNLTIGDSRITTKEPPAIPTSTRPKRTRDLPPHQPQVTQGPEEVRNDEEVDWSDSDVGRSEIDPREIPSAHSPSTAPRPSSRSPLETRLSFIQHFPMPTKFGLSKATFAPPRPQANSSASIASIASVESDITVTPDLPTSQIKADNLVIWQLNANKSPHAHPNFIQNTAVLLGTILAIQELYLDYRNYSRVPTGWSSIYPTTHNTPNAPRSRSLLAINPSVSSNSWEQLECLCPNITAVRMITQAGPIIVINVYNPCDSNTSLPHVEGLLKKRHPDDLVILLGDFNRHHPLWDEDRNAHLFTRANLDLAQELLDLTAEHDLEMALPKDLPTLQAFGTKNLTRPDNVFASYGLLSDLISCDIAPDRREAYTDHFPIRTEIALKPTLAPDIERWNFKAMDADLFRSTIRDALENLDLTGPLDDQSSLDARARDICQAIRRAMETSVPRIQLSARTKRWWNKELTRFRKKVRKLANRSFRARMTPTHPVHEQYKAWRNTYSQAIKDAKKRHWEDFLESLDEETVWTVTKYIDGDYTDGGRTKVPSLKSTDADGNVSIAKDSDTISDFLMRDFFPAPPAPSDKPSISMPPPVKDLPELSVEDVKAAISCLKPFKAPGPDGIPACAYLEGIDLLAPCLLPIFLSSLCNDLYPSDWRHLRTVVLRKPGKPDYSVPKAYCPIALLNIVSKILSSCVATRLNTLAEQHNWLPAHHFRGRPGRTTTDALHLLLKQIKDAWSKDQVASALFLDVKGAFPHANPYRLAENMRKLGVPTVYIRWMLTKLEGRTTCLSFDDYTSAPKPIRNGIDQGCPLSVIFYLLYNSPLVRVARKDKDELCVAYIDDITFVVFGDSAEENNKHLASMMKRRGGAMDWSKTHNLMFELDKTGLIHFSCKPKLARPDLELDTQTIKPVKFHTLLGVRDVVPEFCRRLSPAGGFWRKFSIPAPAPSPAARSRIPGGIPSGLQELQEWRSSCY